MRVTFLKNPINTENAMYKIKTLRDKWDYKSQTHINLYLMNAPDPFKSATYERTKWVRCGHLNALHSHVQV